MAGISGRGISLGGVDKVFITADALFCKSMRLLLNSADLLVVFSKSAKEYLIHFKLTFCKTNLVILNLYTIVHTFGQSVYNCVQIRFFCKRKIVL